MCEIIRIAHEAVTELKEYMDGPEERTVRDTISNGILAYRPDYTTNKLTPIIEEEWCKKKGWCPGNHRMDSDWVSNRYNWLDDAGKPLEPNFENDKDGSKSIEQVPLSDMGDVSCDPEEDEPNELVFDAIDAEGDKQWADDVDIAAHWLKKLSRKESFLKEEVDKLTTSQVKGAKAKPQSKAKAKAVIGKGYGKICS